MMDFVISKVALSVCALLVVAVLGGLMDGTRSSEETYELSGMLDDLRELVENAGRASTWGDILWTVPTLSDGEDVTIQVSSGLVRASSGGHSEVRRLSCVVHTWVWDGTMLNSSAVAELDRLAQPMEAVSCERVGICIHLVLVDNENLPMVFLRKAA